MSFDDQRIAALRARFAGSLAGQAEDLRRLVKAGDLEAARQLAHSLAGRAGMFGFGELGETARLADEAEERALRMHLEALLNALREASQEG